MFKRIMAVVFCFVLLLGTASMAFAKTKKSSSKAAAKTIVKDSEPEEGETETVIEKISEPKGDLKDKISLSFSTLGDVTCRLWMTKSLGLDLLAGIGLGGGSDFSLVVGSNVVFPIVEEKDFNLYVTPGLLIGLTTDSVQDVSNSSDISFLFNGAIEAEAFIVKNLLSLGGSFGLRLGINVNSTTLLAPDPDLTTSTTTFQMDLGSTTGALFVRIYI